MTKIQPRAVIFDLDGTLADTSGDLIAAANTCFVAKRHPAALDAVADAATAFSGARAMLRLGYGRLGVRWDESDIEADYPLLLQAYEKNIDVFTTLYDGVLPALDQLAAQGVALGICTNKPDNLAKILLGKLGILDRFQAVLGAGAIDVRKPDARHVLETIKRVGGTPARSVLIGDTINDRAAAENAGVPCVLVTFGPTGRDVANLKPEALLDHFDDLGRVLETILPT